MPVAPHTGPVRLDRPGGRPETGLAGLKELADAIGSNRQFDTHLVATPGARPFLRVANRAHGDLAENIFAGPGPGGQWFFWWPWRDPITPLSDTGQAAGKIAAVLTARDTH